MTVIHHHQLPECETEMAIGVVVYIRSKLLKFCRYGTYGTIDYFAKDIGLPEDQVREIVKHMYEDDLSNGRDVYGYSFIYGKDLIPEQWFWDKYQDRIEDLDAKRMITRQLYAEAMEKYHREEGGTIKMIETFLKPIGEDNINRKYKERMKYKERGKNQDV